jgi:hypothetical protein
VAGEGEAVVDADDLFEAHVLLVLGPDAQEVARVVVAQVFGPAVDEVLHVVEKGGHLLDRRQLLLRERSAPGQLEAIRAPAFEHLGVFFGVADQAEDDVRRQREGEPVHHVGASLFGDAVDQAVRHLPDASFQAGDALGRERAGGMLAGALVQGRVGGRGGRLHAHARLKLLQRLGGDRVQRLLHPRVGERRRVFDYLLDVLVPADDPEVDLGRVEDRCLATKPRVVRVRVREVIRVERIEVLVHRIPGALTDDLTHYRLLQFTHERFVTDRVSPTGWYTPPAGAVIPVRLLPAPKTLRSL